MSQEILVNVTSKEVRVALLENAILQEVYIERRRHQGLIGNIYKGRVNRLLPGIQAAFVDIGLDRSAFLHISDMGVVPENTDDFSTVDIRDYLTVGKEILVQVYKDPIGSKGARLTTQFTIPSRFIVLTPGMQEMSVSQKITSEAERERLLSLIQPSPEGGYIFRTVAEGASAMDVARDQAFLTTLWQEVQAKARVTKSAQLVYEEIPIVSRVIRDLSAYDVDKILVDDASSLRAMQDFAARYVPELVNKIELYHHPRPLFFAYSVEEELQKALERKVPLKSGGHVVFDQTEAMTTIDVNTGSYVGRNNIAQTIFTTNSEAVAVIARQVRLRNLGGIIIIDFIDMIDAKQKAQLLEALSKALAKDSAKTQISELSSLGLVQMTRKRNRESLEHILCVECPLCHKRGSIKSLSTVCYELFRELKRINADFNWAGYQIIVSPLLIQELKGRESQALAIIETELGKTICLKEEANYSQDRYDILPLSEKGMHA